MLPSFQQQHDFRGNPGAKCPLPPFLTCYVPLLWCFRAPRCCLLRGIPFSINRLFWMRQWVPDPEVERGEDRDQPRITAGAETVAWGWRLWPGGVHDQSRAVLRPPALPIVSCEPHATRGERNSTEMCWDSGQSPAPWPYEFVWSQCGLCTCNE